MIYFFSGDKVIAEYMDTENLPYESNLSNYFLKSSKAVPRIGRRKDITLKVKIKIT